MHDEELILRLKERGYVIGQGAVRDDGAMLWLINDVFMFRHDAVDLANGMASLENVIGRNGEECFRMRHRLNWESSRVGSFQELKDDAKKSGSAAYIEQISNKETDDAIS
jgi:hypothetical protein